MKISPLLHPSRLVAFVALLGLIVVADVVAPTDRAQATTPTLFTDRIVATGFATMNSALTRGQKQKFARFVSDNPGILELTCTGYAGYNYLNKPTNEIKKLARKRAINACDFIQEELGNDVDVTIRAVTTTSQEADARKVAVKFTYTPDTIYRFSWNIRDADGAIYIGPSSTAIIDLLIYLPTVPDDQIDGDVIPGNDFYGFSVLFTANGSATYFGGWSTTPDGTGTMYWAGSGATLPDLGPGIHTLYAIYSQG